MGINFPNSPSLGQVFQASNGPTYAWNGSAWAMVGPSVVTVAIPQRNRVVNPAMQISQENGTAGGTTIAYYLADQWSSYIVSSGVFNFRSIITEPSPNGSNGLITSCATADAAVAAGDLWGLVQSIEGTRCQDFLWGTANARQVVLRFWVKAHQTGTFAICLRNTTISRTYPVNFTIGAADVDKFVERIAVIPGCTDGAWPLDITRFMELWFCFACGTNFQGTANSWNANNAVGTAQVTNHMATVGNQFIISDVGLYLDPDRTGLPPKWETPNEADTLEECRRYWECSWPPNVAVGSSANGGSIIGTLRAASTTATDWFTWFFREPKRVSAAITIYSNTGYSGGSNTFTFNGVAGVAAGTGSPTTDNFWLRSTGSTGLVVNQMYPIQFHWVANARL